MNKLQLYITKSYRGFKSLVNFNPTEDVRRLVIDIRDAVARVNYDPNEKNIFYLVKYTGKGTFLIVIRTIPAQPVDHLAAWIYIPNGLQITSGDLTTVMKVTQRKISQQGVGEDDLSQLREVFSKEYVLDRNAAAIPSSLPGDKYAYCNYGGLANYRFEDYLACGLFQPVFANYSGVLFIDNELGLTANAADLSSTELARVVTILPPDRSKTDFVPYIYGVLFDRPFKAALNRNINIVWKRAGFESTTQTVTVERDNFQPQGISTVSQQKFITPASFYITSQQSHDPVSNAVIEVNGVRITSEGHMFKENELKSASVSVKAEGFEPYSGTLDLASTTKALIKLQDRGRVYRFELPLKSTDFGGPLRLSLHTKHTLDQSPIEGYEVMDEIQEGSTKMNHLIYAPATKSSGWFGKLIWGIIGLGVGALGMMLCQIDLNSIRSGKTVAEETAITEAQAVEALTEDAELPAVDPSAENAVENADVKGEDAQALARAEAKNDAQASGQAPAPATEDKKEAATTPDKSAPAATTTPEKTTPEKTTPSAPASAATSKTIPPQALEYLDNNPVWKKSDLEGYPGMKGLWDDLNSMNCDVIINVWGPKLKGSKNFEKVVKAAKQSKQKHKDVHREGRTVYTKDNQFKWLNYTWWIDP